MRYFTNFALKQVSHCLEDKFLNYLASLGYNLVARHKLKAITLKISSKYNFSNDTTIFWNLFLLKKRPFFSLFFTIIFFGLSKCKF